MACHGTGGQAGRVETVEVDVEYLLDLAKKRQVSDDGLTTNEWVEVLGINRTRVQAVIGKAVRDGVMARGRRMDPDHWSGTTRWFTVYRVVDQNKDLPSH